MKLSKNSAKCRLCGDVLVSEHRHDFRQCECGEIFIDGGLDYVRWGAKDLKNIIDLCEYEDNDKDAV